MEQGIIIAGYKLAFKTHVPKSRIINTLNKYNDLKCDVNIIYVPQPDREDYIYIALAFYLLPYNGIINVQDLEKVISTPCRSIPIHFADIIHELSLQPSSYTIFCDHVDHRMIIY